VADFKLPELGENVSSGDVLRILVKAGDTVVKDQPILELETDKATIEVPSSVAGRVIDIKVKPGDKVKVGQVILSVDSAGADAAAPPPPNAKPAAERPAETVQAAPPVQSVQSPPNIQPVGSIRPAAQSRDDKVVDISRGARASAEPATTMETAQAPAAPSVRRMARELGVDIDAVPGTGSEGRISIDDVKAHAKRLVAATHAGGGIVAEPLPDFSRWGAVERQPMRAVRRKTAEHLSAAWATIPHVTQHALADITALEELRKRYAKQAEVAGGNLTVTAVATKVVAAALKVFPQFNVSIDFVANEIIAKKYVNVGIAVDTDRGLLVPVVRDVDTKNMIQIAVEISQLSEKARTRKITLEEMQGGCFTVSNLGGIGGTYFTPIINAPEVAILGISRGTFQPVWREANGAGKGEFVPRQLLPLSLSYDHRVIDGADGIRFLKWIVEALEQPFLLALQG
jgi:pyruvate dehydrogenase E2 component (dihydrolipoamide acetyltransferase)